MKKLGLTKFEAKIGQENEPSIRMFQKLHFKQVRASVGRPREVELLVFELEAVTLLAPTGGCEQCLPGGDTQAGGERARAEVDSGADEPHGRETLQGGMQ